MQRQDIDRLARQSRSTGLNRASKARVVRSAQPFRDDDREWLAEKCGVIKRTVENWFTKDKFPPLKKAIILELMKNERTKGREDTTITISIPEMRMYEKAARLLGHQSAVEFITHTLSTKAEEALAVARNASMPLSRVAETPPGADEKG